jgi:hypothetical protein
LQNVAFDFLCVWLQAVVACAAGVEDDWPLNSDVTANKKIHEAIAPTESLSVDNGYIGGTPSWQANCTFEDDDSADWASTYETELDLSSLSSSEYETEDTSEVISGEIENRTSYLRSGCMNQGQYADLDNGEMERNVSCMDCIMSFDSFVDFFCNPAKTVTNGEIGSATHQASADLSLPEIKQILRSKGYKVRFHGFSEIDSTSSSEYDDNEANSVRLNRLHADLDKDLARGAGRNVTSRGSPEFSSSSSSEIVHYEHRGSSADRRSADENKHEVNESFRGSNPKFHSPTLPNVCSRSLPDSGEIHQSNTDLFKRETETFLRDSECKLSWLELFESTTMRSCDNIVSGVNQQPPFQFLANRKQRTQGRVAFSEMVDSASVEIKSTSSADQSTVRSETKSRGSRTRRFLRNVVRRTHNFGRSNQILQEQCIVLLRVRN